MFGLFKRIESRCSLSRQPSSAASTAISVGSFLPRNCQGHAGDPTSVTHVSLQEQGILGDLFEGIGL